MDEQVTPPRLPPVVEEKSFLQALFDFKFSEWVTLRVAGILYFAGIALITLFVLIILIAALTSGVEFALRVGAFLVAIIVWFLLVLLSRLAIEASIATIAVAQNTASLRK